MRAARGEGAAREGARGGAGGESAPGAAAPAALPFARLRSRRRPASPPFPRGGLLSSSSRSPRPGPARGVASPGAFLCAPTSPRLSCAERSPCGRGAADPCLPCWPRCARSTRGTVGCRAARARCWIVPAACAPRPSQQSCVSSLRPPGPHVSTSPLLGSAGSDPLPHRCAALSPPTQTGTAARRGAAADPAAAARSRTSRNGALGEGSARHPLCRETGGALPSSARGTAGRPGAVSNVGRVRGGNT